MPLRAQTLASTPPENEGWLSVVLQLLGPLEILGTPRSLSSAPGPHPSLGGKRRRAGSPTHRHWDLELEDWEERLLLLLQPWAMDPHEMVVKNPYAHISIPRAHLRPDLGQQLEEGPSSSSCSEIQPLPSGTCAPESTGALQPTEASGLKGAKGAKGAALDLSQEAWQPPCNPYSSGQRPSGLTYAGQPPVGRGDDIAHHCCCFPCCSCCHCPRFCRCHSCCCVVS